MSRGSKPGEHRGGRKAGTPNKATAEIKSIAQQYGPEAIEMLIWLMRNAENEQTRVAAIKEMLDRGYGKSPQAHEGGDPNKPIVHQVSWLPATDR